MLEEVVGTAAAVARLRDEVFDAVLISHEPPELDALELCEGYRAGGAEEPLVVLGTESQQEMAVWCYEVGADGYLCLTTATTRNLIWVVARAVQRHHYVRDNQRLQQAEQQRLLREHEEAKRLLEEQRAMLAETDARRAAAMAFPPELIEHYRELLRTYVIMGSGSLAAELRQLAEVLVTAGLSRPAKPAIALARGRGDGTWTRRPQQSPCDDPGRPAGVGSDAVFGRGLSRPLPGTGPSAPAVALAGVRVKSRNMQDSQTTVAELKALIADFVARRDWQQFHAPKNLAMSVAIEAAELMEHFQWLTAEQSREVARDPRRLAAVGEELADVLCYALALGNALGLDLSATVAAKVAKNALKYPEAEYRGRYGPEDDTAR